MKLLVVCGATATGKSQLAIALAHQFDGEIVNADSMQLYRGMDIGTAKLSPEEREGVAHHLLDVLDVNQDSTVAWFQSAARAAITDIHARGKSAIVVGGTGLYIKSILDELNFPDTDPEVRKKLEKELEDIGLNALFERLEKLDPAAAIAIDRANARRVIRALEVIEITGKPFTANLPREASTRYPDARQFGLVMDREKLDERISARVDRMWDEGFVAEVETLLQLGLTDARTAQLALGYSQIIAYLDGKMSQDEAREDTKRATRQYARRQETWFSRDERITWISPVQPHLQSVLAHLEKLDS
ncbi:MAG: tRNA (adenosine(37)-N6)-dimethylallyltransferase MiaA [Actinobacteria bacterium]|uniref:tRNA dimethylallyltransferase n=1 Tax=freshwater metagenome TaxID=449393 RepID=A0A6J7VQ46_9ZZZZ|nr:tRNA (adenosine(37)-N6)-dimethylallyltransferase MiaA [Actinomycetota bacterium]